MGEGELDKYLDIVKSSSDRPSLNDIQTLVYGETKTTMLNEAANTGILRARTLT